MTIERVEFGGCLYEVHYDDSGMAFQVSKLAGRFIEKMWVAHFGQPHEVSCAIYLARCQREERELRNST